MKRFFNWVFILAGIAGAFYGMGLIVPRTVTTGSKTNLQCSQDVVFAAVADVHTWPQWHPDVSAVSELPERMDHQRWTMTDKNGERFELEVTAFEEPTHWTGVYERKGARITLRFDQNWFGTGARVRVTRVSDTKDPWERARNFVTPDPDSKPVAILTALTEYLGQTGVAEEDK